MIDWLANVSIIGWMPDQPRHHDEQCEEQNHDKDPEFKR
jgi:hypothetical protein